MLTPSAACRCGHATSASFLTMVPSVSTAWVSVVGHCQTVHNTDSLLVVVLYRHWPHTDNCLPLYVNLNIINDKPFRLDCTHFCYSYTKCLQLCTVYVSSCRVSNHLFSLCFPGQVGEQLLPSVLRPYRCAQHCHLHQSGLLLQVW